MVKFIVGAVRVLLGVPGREGVARDRTSGAVRRINHVRVLATLCTSPPASLRRARRHVAAEASAPEDARRASRRLSSPTITNPEDSRSTPRAQAERAGARDCHRGNRDFRVLVDRRAPKIRVVGPRRFNAGVTRRRRPSSMHTNVDPRAGERLESRGVFKDQALSRTRVERSARARVSPPPSSLRVGHISARVAGGSS